ncbi:MAG: hypothetical protein HYS33_00565, partial [Acidobacteria bacterium]|nr:hypothetical protein [Acidobacteriota bacterium]
YKAYDFDAPQPASVSSKVIHDLLRVKLGYRGLKVADLWELFFEISPARMMQQGLTMNLQVCLLSIKGGCDLQILNWGPKIAELVLPAIRNGLEGGSLTRERVDEALQRIRAAKKRLKRPSGKLRARGFDRLAREFEKFAGEFRAGEEKIA